MREQWILSGQMMISHVFLVDNPVSRMVHMKHCYTCYNYVSRQIWKIWHCIIWQDHGAFGNEWLRYQYQYPLYKQINSICQNIGWLVTKKVSKVNSKLTSKAFLCRTILYGPHGCKDLLRRYIFSVNHGPNTTWFMTRINYD